MKPRFSYYMPTRILFGPNRLRDLAKTPHLPGRKALVVIGAGQAMRRHGYLDLLLKILKAANVECIVFDRILPNPVVEHVMEGAALARLQACDFVIGLGGGSSIDSAKSIAVMATNPGHYWDYLTGGSAKGQPLQARPLPIVAIPTTAGTGTEADPWTVITKPDTKEKIGWGCDETFPALSVVDPTLMTTVPPELTAFQGMDAFFHAVEGYLATVSQPASDHYALDAVRLIARYLPVAVRDGKNMEARTAMAWASTEAGIVESLSCCISHHSLEHAISAFHPDVPHGAGLVMTSVAYFTALARKAPSRFPALAEAMGEKVSSLPEEERPMAFITALRRLIDEIGLSDLSPERYGIGRDEMDAIARNSFETMGGLYKLNPAELSLEDVTAVLGNSFRSSRDR